ncbi:hypothetical protein CC85DRAFT_244958 [Cutaneotrichosporon oleaginosum]|uniref:Stealth protein CR3 conserved region 3 domain-containing protein n=1 Tax=Cutaneotrichosporon oleaginosum TaxID=879819 RepID=A0A0J0XPG9_9TREE|nr:uncharacterized protein CC85DRAFT_244958 [Cutaneotrichosporon oleaginosum]KLT42962.1 hypothetical protein CC85DRAFT_244958 [Cutaneotrichosporon oleaginosum]TXT11829.1 hypothetical protein COLE_02239 [Cutaneotrichosporon oleaginosum]
MHAPDYGDVGLIGVDGIGANDATFNSSDGILTIPDDPTHLLIPTRSPRRKPVSFLTPYETRPPLDMLTEFFMTGEIKYNDPSTHPTPKMDLVYMFVNASSEYFFEGKDAKMAEEGLPRATKGHGHHFRDNGELRGAVRSGALAFGDRIRDIHLITGSFEIPEKSRHIIPSNDELARLGVNTSDITGWKVGQLPEWLDYEHRANVKYHVHADIYNLPRDDDGRVPPVIADVDEDKWRELSLPTFNSFEIECRVSWVEGLAENFIFSNDDMFFLGGLSTSDFHHPLLGPVLRIEPEMMIKPEVLPDLLSASGEWGGLQHAALVLADRFPYKRREYLHHMPKAFTKTMAHESSIMFAEQMTTAATRAFRESKRGRADIEMAFVMAHLQIERWREGLLWTYIVAKLGGQDGLLREDARDQFRKTLRVPKGNEGDGLMYQKRKRSTLQDVEDMAYGAGWENALHTRMYFSSFDGHIPASKKVLHNGEPKHCIFSVSQCLPENFFSSGEEVSAVDVFKTIAFEKPGCGDCLIDVLVNQSGERGLSAFFPSADALYFPPKDQPPRMWERPEPILPLTPTWKEADFSMAYNVRTGQDAWKGVRPRADGAVRMREWCVKLLSRYTYTYGRTPSRFYMVHNPREFTRYANELSKNDDVVFTCINDDQPDDANGAVRQRFQAWMEKLFGGDSRFVRYERPDAPWGDGEEIIPDPVEEEDKSKGKDKDKAAEKGKEKEPEKAKAKQQEGMVTQEVAEVTEKVPEVTEKVTELVTETVTRTADDKVKETGKVG